MVNFVRIWILLSTLLIGSGWILSALHQLNRAGYTVIFGMAGAVSIWWLKKNKIPVGEISRRMFRKFPQRFKRLPAFLFLVLALLTLVAGSLYPVVNWDANSYRLPRIFHWLWENQWHWIHTFNSRMNVAGCGFEWLSAPLILFSRTDRLLFLINWASYLMLPGLIFSVFTRLQVRPRAAWWWMWFLSSGWCFVLQASSAANDSFAAIYALAAVDLALRAREKNSVTDLWLSLFAVALLTGAKQTNIPLALMWLIAAWPAVRLLSRHLIGTTFVATLALLVSTAPVCFFNYEHYGTFLPTDAAGIAAIGKFHLNPFWGIIGNAFCIPVQNLVPPFFELLPPFYDNWITGWNELMSRFLQTPAGGHFASFEIFGFLSAGYDRGISEGTAGIGLGICILILVSIWKTRRLRAAQIHPVINRDRFLSSLRVALWGALLLFMAVVGTFENARQLAPYYSFLFPLFLTGPNHEKMARQRSWQRLGLAIMAFTGIMVVTLNARPLFPASLIFDSLHRKFPNNELVAREWNRYVGCYYRWIDVRRKCLQKMLPPGENVIGYYAELNDGDEPGIWLPYGQRRVEWILPEDSPEQIRMAGIHYAVIHSLAVKWVGQTMPQWMNQHHATLVGQFDIIGNPVSESVTNDPNFWGLYLVQFHPPLKSPD